MGKHFVIEVENRPGALSHLFHVLAMREINVFHSAGVSGGPNGLVVLSLSDDVTAREVLREEGYAFSENDSLVLRVQDRPGALADVTEILAAAGVNVTSVLEVGRHSGNVDTALTVDDLEKALAALQAADIDSVAWRAG